MNRLDELFTDMASFTYNGKKMFERNRISCTGGCCNGYYKGGPRGQVYEPIGSRGQEQQHKYFPLPSITKNPMSPDFLGRVETAFKDWARSKDWKDNISHVSVKDDPDMEQLTFKICLKRT